LRDPRPPARSRGGRAPCPAHARRRIDFYREALRLARLADWSSTDGRVVFVEARRATLELLDEAQAEMVDAIEAGRRVSATVRRRSS
jgi:hypothetical protein